MTNSCSDISEKSRDGDQDDQEADDHGAFLGHVWIGSAD